MNLYALLRLLVLVAFSILPAVSQAAFRCQGKLPYGFNKMDLLNYCGEPSYRDSYTKPVIIEGKEEKEYGGCETVDQWYYTDEQTNSTIILDIERGIVTKVGRGMAAP